MRRLVEPLLRLLDANDVLFAPNFFIPRSQMPFGRCGVATVHDMAFRVMPRTVAPETLAELEQNLPPSLFRVERLIAVSEATAEDVVEHLQISRHRIHTVHEGLDPRFTPAPLAGREDQHHQADEAGARPGAGDGGRELPARYLLFVSTLEPRKNVSGILSAFRLMVEWGYTGHLVLVGRWGWRTEEIRAQLETSPVRHRISHLEDVSPQELPVLYRRADALLFPSWLEGFGLPLLEGMACGVPVVTSGLSAMPEVAGSAAVYVDPASPHGIASAVSSLVEDPQLRARLVERGRERASRFSWDRAAAATAQVLRQAAGLRVTAEDEYRV
jgi:glycosyltransferase involved in cell wall biosynthesis